MIPNRIIRYFFMLQYALFRSGSTRFATYKAGIIHFYGQYLHPQHYLKNPAFYPNTYGRN